MPSSPLSGAPDHPTSNGINFRLPNAVTGGMQIPLTLQGPLSEVEHPSLDMGNACFKKRPLESSNSQDAAVVDTAPNAGLPRNTRICTAPIHVHTLASHDSARLDQNFPMQGDASNQEDGIIEGEPPYAAPLQPHQPPIG